VVPVKKFTDRNTAVRRIWNSLQSLDADAAPKSAVVAPKRKQAGKAQAPHSEARRGRQTSKADQILRLLKRASGATLDELTEATKWQPHTVRGFISGALRKRSGVAVESRRREDGARVYRINS
jgi:hypothetical protein